LIAASCCAGSAHPGSASPAGEHLPFEAQRGPCRLVEVLAEIDRTAAAKKRLAGISASPSRVVERKQDSSRLTSALPSAIDRRLAAGWGCALDSPAALISLFYNELRRV